MSRSRRALTLTAPGGDIWAIPHAAPITIRHIVHAPQTKALHQQNMDILKHAKPVAAYALMKQAAMLVAQLPKHVRARAVAKCTRGLLFLIGV